MKRKIICLFIVGLLVLAAMIMSGCNEEETTVPLPEATPASISTPEPTPAEAPPVAQISVTPSTAKIGESIIFSGAGSTDSDGNITSYQWYFDDARIASGEIVTHTYSDRCGKYKVQLTVSDNDDLSDTAEVIVEVLMGVSIRIEANASTWRVGEQPYDIYGEIEQKLEATGFEVVPQESTVFDARLLVDYKEEKGSPYSPLGGTSISGYGTNIKCTLGLYNKAQSLILEKDIFAGTSGQTIGDLHGSAVVDFESEHYIKYIGDITASNLGVGGEVSDVICNIADEELEGLEEFELETLIEALRIGDRYVKNKITPTLVKIGGGRAVELLLIVLNNGSGTYYANPENLVWALGELGDARAVESLILLLKGPGFVQRAAVIALGKIGDARAVEPLIELMPDKDSWTGEEIAKALGKIGESAVDPLIQALQHEKAGVRMQAAEALGEIGDVRAVEPLTQALEDEYLGVRNAAEQALKKIRGE